MSLILVVCALCIFRVHGLDRKLHILLILYSVINIATRWVIFKRTCTKVSVIRHWTCVNAGMYLVDKLKLDYKGVHRR